jgi:hypothetical protein
MLPVAGQSPPARGASQALLPNDLINCNAGDHSVSVGMRYVDYVQVEKPELGKFTE